MSWSWLPQHMAVAMGCVITIGLLGGIVAQTPLILLSDYLGWREAFLVLAGFGLMVWMILWCCLKNHPNYQYPIDKKNLSRNTVINNALTIVCNQQNWWLALYTCFLNLPIILLGEVWGVAYLSNQNGLDTLHAANVVSMIYVGTIVGSPLIGLLSDKMRNRKILMMISAMISLVITLVVIFDPRLSFVGLASLFFLIGFFTSTQLLSYPLIVSKNPHELTTSALGFASIIVMGGGGIFQPVFGWLVDRTSDITLWGVGLTNYQIGLGLIPAAFLVCVFLAWLVRENKIAASKVFTVLR